MPSKAFEYLNSQNKINEAETKTTILEQIPVEPKNDFEKKLSPPSNDNEQHLQL